MLILKALQRFFFLLVTFGVSISHMNSQTKIQFGVSACLGTHVNRIGFFIQPSYFSEYAGFQIRATYYCVLSGIGIQKNTDEFQLQNVVFLCMGKIDSTQVYVNDVFSNQGDRPFSVIYSFNKYFDHSQTSQNTGCIGIQNRNFRILTENDLFAMKKQDRYRTAAIIFTMIKKEYLYSIKSVLWTGDSFDKRAIKIIGDSLYKSRFGYKDLQNAHYGKHSNGILCFQIDKYADYSMPQNISISAGIDAEQVRHFLQNKIIHDMYFIPECIISYKNVHCPMLQKDGTPFLKRPGQKIRNPKVYFNVGINEGLFY